MKMLMTRGLVWAVASLVLMLVGAFGPWAKVLNLTINGTDDGRDGWVVVGAAVVAAAAVLLYLWRPRRWVAAISLLAGCAGGATAAYDISDIRSFGSGTLGEELVSTEWGIYLALVGSVSLILAALALVFETRRQPHAATADRQPQPVG